MKKLSSLFAALILSITSAFLPFASSVLAETLATLSLNNATLSGNNTAVYDIDSATVNVQVVDGSGNPAELTAGASSVDAVNVDLDIYDTLSIANAAQKPYSIRYNGNIVYTQANPQTAESVALDSIIPSISAGVYMLDFEYAGGGGGSVCIGDQIEKTVTIDSTDVSPAVDGIFINGSFYDTNTGEITFCVDPSDTTVSFAFSTLYIDVINSLSIAADGATPVDYSNNLPSTKDDLEAHYLDQHFFVQIDGATLANTSYAITATTSQISDEQQFMGNFLWENDPTAAGVDTDDIIDHGTLSFVSAVIDGQTYTSIDSVNDCAGHSNVCSWSDSIPTEEDPDGSTGGATFPVGTELTVELIPDAGYQLTSFGINGGSFDPQEEIGTYTFTIRGGNAHLAASFEAVDDEVNAESDAVAYGSIEFSGTESSMANGTARLDVTDAADLTDEQINSFNTAANGYNISNYLDISLFNTVYAAQTGNTWDTQVTELDHSAIITLQLEDGADGNDIVIIHERHDGTYEVIETTYNPVANTITFTTDSFSNYAIATRTAGNPDTGFSQATSVGGSATTSSLDLAITAATIIMAGVWLVFFATRKI